MSSSCIAILCIFLLPAFQVATPFIVRPSLSRREVPIPAFSLSMISNLMNIGGKAEPSLPKDVKEAVLKCRTAVQKGLEDRLSRMDVEFPVGTKFSVEKGSSGGKKRGRNVSSAIQSNEGAPTKDMFDTSDRELARLFVEMFQPVGGNAITVVFKDEDLADIAKKRWKGDVSADCIISSVHRGKKTKALGRGMGGGKAKGKKKMGFAAKMNEEFNDASSGPFKLPEKCEVALFVSPDPKELIAVNKICDEVGMGSLVILLNARLSNIENFGSDEAKDRFENEFESVFYLSTAPQDAAPGCLMHRAYPTDWIVARKPKVGPSNPIASFNDYPTADECLTAYESIEVGDWKRGLRMI